MMFLLPGVAVAQEADRAVLRAAVDMIIDYVYYKKERKLDLTTTQVETPDERSLVIKTIIKGTSPCALKVIYKKGEPYTADPEILCSHGYIFPAKDVPRTTFTLLGAVVVAVTWLKETDEKAKEKAAGAAL